MYEQTRRSQVGQMLDAKLFRFTRWMQRVRKQKESGHKIWVGGAEHCRLAPTVGVAAQKDPARDALTQNCNRIAQACAIAFRIARKRRACAPLLAERQIAAQDNVAMSGKSFADRDQKRSSAIRARSVSEDQGVAVWVRRRVQEAADGGVQ